MTVTRRVHFAEDPVASTHSYPAMDKETVSLMFYNVEDYRRFRVERAQADIEKAKAVLRLNALNINKTWQQRSRRDSLTMGQKSAPYQRNRVQEGVALAAWCVILVCDLQTDCMSILQV